MKEKGIKKYVSVNVDCKGEITAQIRFTSDEIMHLLWSGADWYDGGKEYEQKRLAAEGSICDKLGYASDLMDDVAYSGHKKADDPAKDHGFDFMAHMNDQQVIGGAYELSKLLQFGCEHYGTEPTTENMNWVYENITTSAPLNRASALEYAGRLIEGAAFDLEGDEEPPFPF